MYLFTDVDSKAVLGNDSFIITVRVQYCCNNESDNENKKRPKIHALHKLCFKTGVYFY